MAQTTKRPAAGIGGSSRRIGTFSGQASNKSNVPIQVQRRGCCGIIRAELTGCNVCTALGTVAIACAPVLALCRKLVAAGHDPAMPLEVWRANQLALRIRSIGEAAGLTVEDDRHGRPRFRRWRERGVAQADQFTKSDGPQSDTTTLNVSLAVERTAPRASQRRRLFPKKESPDDCS